MTLFVLSVQVFSVTLLWQGCALADPLFATQHPAITIGSRPIALAVGDLNRDGKLDLVALQQANVVAVMLGNHTGTFGPYTNYATGIEPHSVAIADLNDDNTPDVVVANSYSSTVSVFLGNGDGTCALGIEYGGGYQPTGVAAGDFNRDGKLDLAVANAPGTADGGGDVAILLGNGDGSFRTPTTFGTKRSLWAVAIGDLNCDGKLDLAVADASSGVEVLLGDGAGGFGASTRYETGSNRWGSSVAIGDLSGDGIPDLAVANEDSRSVSVLLGRGNGTFGVRTDFAAGAYPHSVAMGDLDGDGALDLVVADTGSDSVVVLFGDGSGAFGTTVAYPTGKGPKWVAMGDLNDDGKLDLAVGNEGELFGPPSISVLLNSGGHPWVGVPNFPRAAGPLRVAAWPNPIVGDAHVSITLPANAEVNLSVYDVAGRLVSTVAQGSIAAGTHEARWNMSERAFSSCDAGVYLVVLRAGADRATTRVVVLR